MSRRKPLQAPRPDAHERILTAASHLFSRRSVGAVGINELIDEAEVAKATFYSHFPSKDEVVLAFLRRREETWTRRWVEDGARAGADTAEGQLLAIFDLFDGWFRREDFEGCSFVNVLLEFGGQSGHPAAAASTRHLETIREVVAGLAEEAGLDEPMEFARSWHILMKGAIVQAAEGDFDAAMRAQRMGRHLIDAHRPA